MEEVPEGHTPEGRPLPHRQVRRPRQRVRGQGPGGTARTTEGGDDDLRAGGGAGLWALLGE